MNSKDRTGGGQARKDGMKNPRPRNVRAENPRQSAPQGEPILDRAFVDTVLGAAQMNLLKDGELAPALFLRLESGEQMVVVLENFPVDADEKRLYLAALGIALVGTERHIAEAVFLSEVWYVEEECGQRNPDISPRQHPQRKEAIAVMGRNRERSRLTHVLQPFHRDEDNQPVFEPQVVAEYNVSADPRSLAESLLDYLFEETGN